MNIGEVSARSGVSERMIRHYEKVGLIAPARRQESGYRVYDMRDVHQLTFVARARDLGFSIAEISKLLALWNDRDRSSSEVKSLALSRAAELDRKARALDEMRQSLEHLAETCHGDDRPDCPILSKLASVQQP